MVDGWETAYRRAVTKRQRLKDEHPLPPTAPDLRDDLALLRELPQDLRGAEVRESCERGVELPPLGEPSR
jgi:hypothetical protein